MNHIKFKLFISFILLPAIISCFYFGLKDPTMKEIVEMARDKCADIPATDSARVHCMINYLDTYCNENWKNKACHEYQAKNCKTDIDFP